MSVGSLVRVVTLIVDTVPVPPLVTKAVPRHRARTGTADTPSEDTPPRAHATPNTTTRRTHQEPRQPLSLQQAVGARSPATRRDCHPVRIRADLDVGGILGPGLHIDRRHRVAAGSLGDEGGFAVR